MEYGPAVGTCRRPDGMATLDPQARLIALGIALLLLLLIIIVAGLIDALTGLENEQATETPIAYSDASLQVSDDVLQYRESIARELKRNSSRDRRTSSSP